MVLWELFQAFFLIGFVSFGGGYAMIPVIERQVTAHQWMTTQQFTDAIAVAGMSPGPIATNSAIFVGFHTSGFAGAAMAALGMALPSLLIAVLVAAFFYRVQDSFILQGALSGLRPVVTALIIYGAFRFAKSNGLLGPWSMDTFVTCAIFAASFFALSYLRYHPVTVILLSGLLGIAFFS